MSNVDKNSWAYWYDVINTKDREDYQFYSRHLEKSDLALEIACGTGRIYLDMLEDGYDVHGLDLSENMLTKLSENAEDRGIDLGETFSSNVSTMDLDYDYDFIYYPFNSIAHVNGDIDSQVCTFENINDHLAENGKFAFDIYVMDFDSINDYGKLESMSFNHEGDKYKFEKWSEVISQTEQRIKSYNRIINLDESTIEWHTGHELSLYPKQQIELLLKSSGFTDYSFYDGFTDDPISEQSDRMGIVAEK